ncbi:caspase family protein [Leptothoe sp. PORK10 BA2]|uniref:caspase family protein n=1 Tax=Leptothoe sp. PORK10 BA2 TaxID=3110254 RepID=UPI002B20B6A1|nr:caspase family protein [Leptothoe sp. PORK10 BA2]MEA5464606.1 caspase family protein [Leptothoe sp. PORK10 BA2]
MTLSAMTITPNPALVHALVVGVETYGLGSNYDLDGPVQDGLGFMDWLLTHQVPPNQVHFFGSPLPKNEPLLIQAKAKGVTVYPATRAAIDGFIRDQLITEQRQGEGLQVFWGGHGVLTKTQSATRRLFFADTTAENKLNLELDSLVQALATAAHGAGFGRQIFWIDACANSYFQGLYETGQAEGAGQRYSATGEVEKAEQFVLFAAADYGVAKNDRVAGTGMFSRAVLEVLEGQPLWPDMEALAKQVQGKLREKGGPEPVYKWVKGPRSEQITAQGKTVPVSKKLGLGQQMKVDRIKQQIQVKQEQIEREKALLGGVKGVAEYETEHTLNRLADDISRLEAELEDLLNV